jgi:hypothetical protein
LLTDFDTNLNNCHDLEDLVSSITRKKKEYTDKAMAKVRGTKKVLAATDPNFQKADFDRRETNYFEAQADALKVATYLNRNHLLICKRIDNGERVIVPYAQLYPINILGKKYLIAWKDYILGTVVTTK